jgi:hypothetical protein
MPMMVMVMVMVMTTGNAGSHGPDFDDPDIDFEPPRGKRK